MPNWCGNTLTVTGSREELARLCAEVASPDHPLDFELILPTPRELLDGEDWFDWRVANWGTKWNSHDAICYDVDGGLAYEFATASAPPVGVLHTLALNYPGLQFELHYNESGMGFLGVMRAAGGAIVGDEFHDYGKAEYEEMLGAA